LPVFYITIDNIASSDGQTGVWTASCLIPEAHDMKRMIV